MSPFLLPGWVRVRCLNQRRNRMKSRMYSHRSRLTRFSALLLTLALMLGLSSCMAEPAGDAAAQP